MRTKAKGKTVKEAPPTKDDMLTDNFDSGSKPNFEMIYNVVLILPIEYDCPTKVKELEECDEQEMARHMPVCYYVMDNGCVEEHNAFFKRPDKDIRIHLKPLFIRKQLVILELIRC